MLSAWVVSQLEELSTVSPDDLVAARYQRFRRLGRFAAETPEIVTTRAAHALTPTE